MRRLALLLSLFFCSLTLRAEVLRIEINGVIHPIAAERVQRAVKEASRRNAGALLIELRTPGGLESSTREIVSAITTSRVPVIVWVAPTGSRAASAGFFILQAADVAAMAPGTNTGAAHPVQLGGSEPDAIMKQKMENDSAAWMRAIASKRGRNVAVAESAVRESKSFTDGEALQSRLIDLVAPNSAQLLAAVSAKPVRRFDGTTVRLDLARQSISDFEPTLRQRVFEVLMDPNVSFVLLALGLMALWAEFSHPGAILPGVVGAVCIVLAVFALNLLPTRFAAFALIGLAIALFIAEAKIVSHGILGIGGAVAMTFGALMLVDGPIPELRIRPATALSVSIPFALIAIFLTSLVLRAHRRRPETGEEGMLGLIGVARTPLDPKGQIFVRGEIWEARSAVPLPVGANVRVDRVDGLLLHVSAASEAARAMSESELSYNR